MAERVSALAGHYDKGRFGEAGDVGVHLSEVRELTLHQVAAWPESLDAVGNKAAQVIGAAAAPDPCAALANGNEALLRIEPLKWWLYGAEAPQLTPEEGSSLDLSHSRTHLRISGPQAAAFLNRLLPLDLREASFPVGTVGSTAMHHVGVTLWRSDKGYELFIPRGFALSLWDVMLETAAQFGAEVA